MKKIIIRTISGSAYVAILCAAIILGGAWLIVLLCLLDAIAMYEFIAMNSETKFPRLVSTIDISIGVMLQLASYFHFVGEPLAAKTFAVLLIALLMTRMIAQLYSRHGNPVNALARSLMAQVYISAPLAMVPLLYYSISSPYIVLGLLIFIWSNDTGAFLIGSWLGKHRLFERISPKKSWEGFFGGLLFCIIAAFGMKYLMPTQYADITIGKLCRLGLLVGVFATFGDLLESMIKRTADVKDSGKIMPGHGGILDRIDSLLMVIPMAAVYFLI